MVENLQLHSLFVVFLGDLSPSCHSARRPSGASKSGQIPVAVTVGATVEFDGTLHSSLGIYRKQGRNRGGYKQFSRFSTILQFAVTTIWSRSEGLMHQQILVIW